MKRIKLFTFLAVATISMLTSEKTVSAQDINSFSLGTFHSPKGIGISMEMNSDSQSFDSLTLLADMHGVLTGEHSSPGIKLVYTRDIIFRHFDKQDYFVDLYAGPGITAGYIRDINEPFSFVAGLSGVAGARFSFLRNLSIDIELCTDLALELNRNNRFRSLNLKIYKSGYYHIFFPQLRIHYCF